MGNTIALPDELVIYVLDYLKHKIFVNMRLICKYVNELILNKGHRLAYFKIPVYNSDDMNVLSKLSECSSNVRLVISNKWNGVNVSMPDEKLDKISTLFDMSKIIVVDMNFWCVNINISDKNAHILTNVNELKLNSNKNKITDSDISQFTNITKLSLVRDAWITYKGIENLTNITDLSLNITYICLDDVFNNLSSNLVNITKLSLRHMKCNNHNMDNLTYMNNVTTLTLGSRSLVTNHILRTMTSLTKLHLSDSAITYDGISLLTGLKSLDLESNVHIIDAHLTNMTYLTCLKLGYTDYITDNGINKLTNLRKLCLRNKYNVSDHSISGLTNLINLKIHYNSKITYKSLSQLTNINTLTVLNNSNIRRYYDDGLFGNDNMVIVWK